MAPLSNLRHHRMFQEKQSTQENWKASHSPSSHTQGEAAQPMSVSCSSKGAFPLYLNNSPSADPKLINPFLHEKLQ